MEGGGVPADQTHRGARSGPERGKPEGAPGEGDPGDREGAAAAPWHERAAAGELPNREGNRRNARRRTEQAAGAGAAHEQPGENNEAKHTKRRKV